MNKHDAEFIEWLKTARLIAGGQEPVQPEEIRTLDYASVYDVAADAWSTWFLTAYRPGASASPINMPAGGLAAIVAAPPLKRLLIVSIALTVSGETNVTLYANSSPISGPMDFGASGEPRGIVVPFPFSPLDCGLGGSFQVGSSAAVQVSGTVCYILI